MKDFYERELQQTVFNNFLDTESQDFMNLYKRCTAEPFSFWLLILLLYQIFLNVLERIFWK